MIMISSVPKRSRTFDTNIIWMLKSLYIHSKTVPFNPALREWDLTDFTLSNARWFYIYSSTRGVQEHLKCQWVHVIALTLLGKEPWVPYFPRFLLHFLVMRFDRMSDCPFFQAPNIPSHACDCSAVESHPMSCVIAWVLLGTVGWYVQGLLSTLLCLKDQCKGICTILWKKGDDQPYNLQGVWSFQF